MNRLAGKNALITGAARGIGMSFAHAYVQQGAKVAVADIDFARAKSTASEIGQQAIAVHIDVTDSNSINAAVADTIDAYGQIDILVNCAAVFTAAPITQIKRADYQGAFDVNVSGTLFTLQAVARHMIERGGGGKIINMASQAGRRGEPLVAVYCATKAAVISLTQSAGLNLITHGINVNAIAPGVVDGEHWDMVDEVFAKLEKRPIGQKKDQVSKSIPYGRIGKADDLVGMAVFLASDESDYVVSQCYNVDGGQWMS